MPPNLATNRVAVYLAGARGGAIVRMMRGPLESETIWPVWREPHAVMRHGMIQKPHQPRGIHCPGTPDKAAMQPDGQHLGSALPALRHKACRRRLSGVILEIAACDPARRGGKTHIIGFEAYRGRMS